MTLGYCDIDLDFRDGYILWINGICIESQETPIIHFGTMSTRQGDNHFYKRLAISQQNIVGVQSLMMPISKTSHRSMRIYGNL